MKKELRIFFTAMMFLTRLPVPRFTDHSPDYLEKSVRYFPLIGWMVAALSALPFLIFNKYISEDIAIVASIIAGILTTGAFHEDGFADVCDAFGGGWTKEKILLIMKDSRLGSYGVIGMMAILFCKFLLLKELPKFTPDLQAPSINIFYNYRYFLLTLFAAHSLSRLMPVLVMRYYEYVTDPDTSKSKPTAAQKPTFPALLVPIITALIPFVFMPWQFLLTIIPVVYIAFSLAKYFKKWIGGYTGDCLGAIQQVSELSFYLSMIIIWRYVL
ncbi:adenosylcobinamide-GDP ribazoletransferase [Niastella yeongjuensis]|uniref:Adenosylcobinamide-GDP ribazoletransferase n=1 Tax=Niastella yeongjuensis TaxID=354355 RepID=A0A1V9EXN3_9BACT|nr:adenosylcobinamide-GDP ribazoletransferase [Niastella yeongjuensis]OQP50888.1 adenosylcobinamide-GDP ribazoletransferase [Niastella yeongjuensis]SEN13055.1 cobalamin-5'-phosphate synthase [Niastella yeongjuensis]